MSMYPESITIHIDPDKIISANNRLSVLLVKDTVTTNTIVDALNDILRQSCDISLHDVNFTATDFQSNTYDSLGVYDLLGTKAGSHYTLNPLRVWIVKKTSDDVRKDPNSSLKDLYNHRQKREFNRETFMVIRNEGEYLPYIAESRQELLRVYAPLSDGLNNFCNRAKHGDMCVVGAYTVIRLRNQI